MSADQLPDELIAEILSRLPAKSVLRFRCVSKSWRDAIESPNFPKSQFSHNRLTEISLFEIVGTDPSEMDLEFTAFDLINCSNQLNILSRKVQLSPLYVSTGLRVVGTCDGFICFSSLYSDEIVLVNPLTREEDCHIFPPKSRRFGSCDVGVGYDPFSDGYKVVLMKRKRRRDGEVEINIYDIKSKTWKQIHFSSNYNNNFIASCYGYYTNGALHWILQDPGNKLIGNVDMIHIAIFDLVNEKLKVMKYDVAEIFGYSNSTSSFSLAILGGCLSLCCKHDYGDDDLGVEIWVMKEYGVEESWSKLVSISIDADADVVPLAMSRCGRKLLVQIMEGLWPCSGSLQWYDMEGECFECTDHKRSSYGFHVCLQSLIQPEGVTSKEK